MSTDSSAAIAVSPGAAGDGAELVVESCGPHVLIRHRDEDPWERSVLTGNQVPPGDVVVLASAGAHRVRSLPQMLSSVLLAVVRPGGRSGYVRRVDRVWLGASGIGSDPAWAGWLHGVAGQFGVELLVPHGTLVLVPGGTLFVAARGGRAGWSWYRTSTAELLATSRFPLPYWDSVLPGQPLAVGGLVADPVPAGLAVRDAGAAPFTGGDLAFAVPVDGQHPKLVLGRPGDRPVAPEMMAALIGRLLPAARHRLLLVPAGPVDPQWIRALADALGHDVVISGGIELVDRSGTRQSIAFDDNGNQAFRPFGTVLRHRPGVSTVEVVDVAPPPRGWSRVGPRHYRPDEAASPVCAEVTSSGLLLGLDDAPAAPLEPLAPGPWTITLGSPGRHVTEPLIRGLTQLIAGLGADHLRTVRIRVAGILGGVDDLRLLEIADDAGVPIDLPTPDARPDSDPDAGQAMGNPASRDGLADGSFAQDAIDADTESVPSPSGPQPSADELRNTMADALTKTRPVTESCAPGRVDAAREPVRPTDSPTRREGSSERTQFTPPRGDVLPAQPMLSRPEQVDITRPAVPATAADGQPPNAPGEARPAVAAPPIPPPPAPVATSSASTASGPQVPVGSPASAGAAPQHLEPVYLAGSRLKDRPSGPAEQDQFAREAAGEFNEALATVNSALATWPALRATAGDAADRAAKIDYIAVCLYLGEGRHGAVALNSALRGGGELAQPGYLPCLVSGLRRLPTERRPVMRQARIGAVAHQWYPAGLVITEPGFLSASVTTDIGVAEADVDFLIWPRSARRTSALALGGMFPEAVFFAGSRFRVLAVRNVEHDTAEGAVPEPHRPRIAVLLRELLPHEEVAGRALNVEDGEALSKLDRALAERHSLALRVLDDPVLAGRWAGVPIGLGEPVAAAAAAQLTGAGS